MTASIPTTLPTEPPLRSLLEYPLPHGKLVIGLQGAPPGWVEPTLTTLGKLLKLPADWNSYGGRPVDPAKVWDAVHLLTTLLQRNSGDAFRPGISSTTRICKAGGLPRQPLTMIQTGVPCLFSWQKLSWRPDGPQTES
jgi:hypothetical protein